MAGRRVLVPEVEVRSLPPQPHAKAVSAPRGSRRALPAGSVDPDSNYTGRATATAALNANTGAIETYSSRGPVQLGSTTTCPRNAVGPCIGVAGGALTSTSSPNWAAADGVQISGAGDFGQPCAAGACFFGTSAAAPHAAACDALLRDALNSPAAAAAINDRTPGGNRDRPPAGRRGQSHRRRAARLLAAVSDQLRDFETRRAHAGRCRMLVFELALGRRENRYALRNFSVTIARQATGRRRF
jgi:hypothetical protein